MASQIMGIAKDSVTATSSSPLFRLGTMAGYDDPTNGYQEFVYGQASGAVTGAGYMCVELSGFKFAMATTTNTAPGTYGHGSRVGAAQAVLADTNYGWFQVYGKGSVRTAGAVAIGTRLNTTATGGALDDDATTGARTITGVTLLTAAVGAATAPDAVLIYPTVGATI